MKEYRTVTFDDLEIEAEVVFINGVKGDHITASTMDCWELTGNFALNGIIISESLAIIDRASKGKVFEYFNEQING